MFRPRLACTFLRILLFAVLSSAYALSSQGRAPAGQSARAQTVAYQMYGIDFSPYENGQDPNKDPTVTADQIKARLTIIAPYTKWARSFSMTTGLENIPPIARSMGLKVAAGAWISKNLSQNDQEIANLIAAANAGNVDIAIVGSEALLRGDVTEAQLLAYMAQVRAAIPSSIPVTAADTWDVLLAHPNVIAASDVVFANFYPYWEGKSIDAAVCDVATNYLRLVAASGMKQVMVSEAGWPSGGNAYGAALPTPANEAQFALQFVTWARTYNVAYFYFEAFNEEWKVSQEGPQGAYWGIWDEYGNLKPWMQPIFDGQSLGSNCTGIPCGAGDPSVAFTFVPPYGDSSDYLEGQECHADQFSNDMAIYIKVGGGWWTKPTFASPVTPLNVDGSWTCNIRTGVGDEFATDIAGFLIRNTYSPPQLSGQSSLPTELYQNSLANLQVSRSVQSISGLVTISGYPLPGVAMGLTGAQNGSTLTAPDGKYSFYNLSSSGPDTVTPSDSPFTFTPPSQTFQTIVGNQMANFSATPVTYLLNVTKTGAGSGGVNSSDGTLNCGATCSYSYLAGDQVSLSATPTQGSVLSTWSGCDLIQNNVCMVAMNSNRTVSAKFDFVPAYAMIHTFSGPDGSVPYSTLAMDKAGNLYGTTFNGGAGYGTVFRLKLANGHWVLNPLYTFMGGSDGAGPTSGVVFGPDGSLYGTTTFGGGGGCNGIFLGCGTVYRLRPPLTACKSVLCPWTETVLYRFQGGSDGLYPMYGALLFDKAGDIYGTVYGGGVHAGEVYELTPSGGGYTFNTLYGFTGGADGGLPYSALVFDSAGNLYGTTSSGGNPGCELGCGVVFELTHGGSGWTEKVLYSFTGGSDGGEPFAGVIFDTQGNLYGGTFTDQGGGGGALFELTPSNGSWNFNLLYGLSGYGGPVNSLSLDSVTGNLYGTTSDDGANGWGGAFKLTPSSGGWTYEPLYDFTNGSDGAQPYGGLVIDSSGHLFGTTTHGGNNSNGVVYEIMP